MSYFGLGAFAVVAVALLANAANTQSAPILVEGPCTRESGVSIDGDFSTFACDVAVIARAPNGNVIIQFTDKAGDDGRVLGFGGVIEGRQGFGADGTQMMVVQRVYLGSGSQPVPAERGTCILNWTGLHRTGGRLISVVCGGLGRGEGHEIRAIAALQAR